MSYKQLTREQRYYIFQEYRNLSQSEIARRTGCHKSTISRELKRHSINGEYRYPYAQQQSTARRHRKTYKITQEIKQAVEQLLTWNLSPEQVCGYLDKYHQITLHHGTVYRHIARDKKAGGQLWMHLRICSKPYRKQRGSNWQRGKVPDRVGIEHRPAIVDEKVRIGDWELDTIVGKDQKSCLLVATERVTKFTVIKKQNGFKAEETADTVINALAQFGGKVKTLTLDNGKEFYRHRKFADALNAQTYFCRPYHSWEKGLVENTNGLIRQYFPKQTDFREWDDDEIQKVADNLNHRPRKTLGYETPSSLFLGIFKPLISDVALEMRM
ncbi:IS30 family transposase [Neisseria perflava]|uniref:IS30 family transposase n=1 Tax=Neisseria perflava TaxID=33053 RepID=UPI0020A0E10A|nr:IS30 family transposase [Neisseria perflava]MCP1773488.1 IS30 family transposase [Neisseria perflava]